MIGAPLEIWRALRDGSRALGHLLDAGDIMIDGDLLQANRLEKHARLGDGRRSQACLCASIARDQAPLP
jgi:hypothetical protein